MSNFNILLAFTNKIFKISFKHQVLYLNGEIMHNTIVKRQ